jgi:hypothetical protein
VIEEEAGDEFFPDFGDFTELFVAFFDGFEEGDDLGAELGGFVGFGAFDALEASQLGFAALLGEQLHFIFGPLVIAITGD